MSRLIVDEYSNLQKVSTLREVKHPPFVRLLAHVFSYIFHPLFIPPLLVLFLVFVHPFLFAGFSEWSKLQPIIQTALTCTFIPLVTIFLLRGLKIIESIHMRTQKDRIIPYIAVMIYYFWNWYVFNNREAPGELVVMTLAVFIASIAGFMANIWIKVSMHALAMGVVVAFVGMVAMNDSRNLTAYLSIAILIAGIVCTSRLIVSDHDQKEIYLGFLLGVVSLLLANYFA